MRQKASESKKVMSDDERSGSHLFIRLCLQHWSLEISSKLWNRLNWNCRHDLTKRAIARRGCQGTSSLTFSHFKGLLRKRRSSFINFENRASADWHGCVCESKAFPQENSSSTRCPAVSVCARNAFRVHCDRLRSSRSLLSVRNFATRSLPNSASSHGQLLHRIQRPPPGYYGSPPPGSGMTYLRVTLHSWRQQVILATLLPVINHLDILRILLRFQGVVGMEGVEVLEKFLTVKMTRDKSRSVEISALKGISWWLKLIARAKAALSSRLWITAMVSR